MNQCLFCSSSFDPNHNLLLETNRWQVILHADQRYLGRSTVLLKRHCASLSEVCEPEWFELKIIIERFELAVCTLFAPTCFNWSCLLNEAYQLEPPVPHVHFHVRPRYKQPVTFNGIIFEDPAFGEHYDLVKREALPAEVQSTLVAQFRKQLGS